MLGTPSEGPFRAFGPLLQPAFVFGVPMYLRLSVAVKVILSR
jgi:hypothetical protein